jgi:hypothetical protein
LIRTIATAPDVLREQYVVMLGGLVASAPLWRVGAAVGSRYRLAWWAAAAAIDMAGTAGSPCSRDLPVALTTWTPGTTSGSS